MKLLTWLFVGVLLSPVFTINAQEAEQCPSVKMNQISYYLTYNIAKDEEIGTLYKKKIDDLKEFSEKHKLKHFKIITEDISLTINRYIEDASEVSFSITFESQFDVNLVDAIRTQFSPQSMSFSSSSTVICNE